ncbi:MAG TPA: TlpA disulfide reductase family protein [Rhodocyclaceae bacterium]|nr:TlpA disulfide reductase family protein [Rhodocyclaceae bacterium]
MNRLARNLLIAAVALAAAGAGYLVSHLQQVFPSDPAGARELLALTLPDAAGASQSMQQWRGKVLVVNFWATWCPPCREEMPGFSRLQSKFSAKNVQFVGIGIDSADKIRQFSHDLPVSYPLLVGGTALMGLTEQLGDHEGGLPFTVILGRDGKLLQTRLGLWQESELEKVLVALAK